MATDDLIFAIPNDLIGKVGILITILQALGIFVILWILFMAVNTFINKKRKNELLEVNQHLIEIRDLLKRRYNKN